MSEGNVGRAANQVGWPLPDALYYFFSLIAFSDEGESLFYSVVNYNGLPYRMMPYMERDNALPQSDGSSWAKRCIRGLQYRGGPLGSGTVSLKMQ
jgi:hypothetical protein